MPESGRCIRLRGVRVHNLKSLDLDLQRRRLIVICGRSGSGKSSLAIDTLYAEGQRRFVETFSAYTRQFLEQCDKPEADRIEGIPPAVAVVRGNAARSNRSTVGTATETSDYLRLLYAKVGQVYCQGCGQEVRQESPALVAEALLRLPAGARFQILFPLPDELATGPDPAAALTQAGYTRLAAGDRTWDLRADAVPVAAFTDPDGAWVILDRLTAGSASPGRVRESVEQAFRQGQGRCAALVDAMLDSPGVERVLDGRTWRRRIWSARLRCEACGLSYPPPEPRLFSFNSPLGACPRCEGFGNVVDLDPELIVPDRNLTLRGGAIAPWRTSAYEHELQTLLQLAPEVGLRVDTPYAELSPAEREIVEHGLPAREYGGLDGFFAALERRKYKTHIRAFLGRWRSYATCPECDGRRLRPESLAVRVGGLNLAEVGRLKISDAGVFFRDFPLDDWQTRVVGPVLDQVRQRLGYLEQVGLGYLTLDRSLRTLSGGEGQRVGLTSALGSSLVNMLYVLDEPSIGLHPADTDRLIDAILSLRDRGNTVVVVEHEEAMIRAADQVVEIGPGAGEHGGRVVVQGTPAEVAACEESLTGAYLAGRRLIRPPQRRRETNRGAIRLVGARGNNLQNVSLDFPLGVLCMVTGVSGSGKSTLVQDTLYPALCRRLNKEAPRPMPCDEVLGAGQVNDVVLVDQSPIGRSPRSNPVTFVKAFDGIRELFAESLDARTRNYTASHFSFNAEEGRCRACNGEGYLEIDMQFLADVYMRCRECGGRRYRREILQITHRGRSIADVLEMTVREAFAFFRGQTRIQAQLKRLIDVGLDYLRLGQPANTLSGGEAQRLKLASFLTTTKRNRVLFILDEPTTGLHLADIVPLQDCFDALLAAGHSLIVVEHNMQLVKTADYVIDLGPGAADQGGRVVAQGTPEQVAAVPESLTGRFLREALAAAAAWEQAAP